MERKVGLIPKVLVNGALGMKEYGVLVTDARTIFVLEKKSSAVLGGAVGGLAGALIADALTSSERSIDYESVDLERLAADEKNIVVPHAQLQSIRMKNGFSGCSLKMEYSDSDGKQKKVSAMLVPPPAFVQTKKSEGVKGRAAVKDYAVRARTVFERALPASISQIGEWRI